jgi:hypothetical protein
VIETPAGCKYVDRGLSNVDVDNWNWTSNKFTENYIYDFRKPELMPGSTCSADNAAPNLKLPTDLTEEATSKDGAEVAFTATASDENPTNPEVSCTPASGEIFPLGETTVNCLATDSAGNKSEGGFKVTVKDTTPPETSIESGPEGPTQERTPTFTFSGLDKVTARADLLFSYKVDTGDWSAYSLETSATLGGSTGLDSGSHTFYVRAKDEAGNEDAEPAERTFSVELTNNPPTADAEGPYEVKEGGSVNVHASGTDPENGALDYAWDLDNNGTFETTGQNAPFDAANVDGPATKTIKIQVSDDKGAKSTDEATVKVSNVVPTIQSLVKSSEGGLPTGKSITFTGTATDPSSADEAAGFLWNWSFDGGLSYSSGSGTSNEFVKTFDNCGSYNLQATATDKDTGVSAPYSLSSNPIQVYNASFRPPIDGPANNLTLKGKVIPVKISVGCDGQPISGLSPTIKLLPGDVRAGEETLNDEIEAYSSSEADTTGIMRPVDGGYIYNLQVPGNVTAKAGDEFTVRVNPFSTHQDNPAGSMYSVLKIRK